MILQNTLTRVANMAILYPTLLKLLKSIKICIICKWLFCNLSPLMSYQPLHTNDWDWNKLGRKHYIRCVERQLLVK